MAADYTITIEVDNGKLSVDQPLLSMKPGETVSWYCDTNAYAVMFLHGVTALKYGKSFFTEPAGTETDPATAKSLNGGVGVFEYKVFAYVGGKKPILVLDPHIIIDDTGGGGSVKKARSKSTGENAGKTK